MGHRASQGIAQEFDGAELGDVRRTERLLQVAEAVGRQPDRSFPQIATDEAELEGIYRLLGNPSVNFTQVLKPHQRQTAQRAREAGEVVVIHDTTNFEFAHADPKEVGYLSTGKPGFYAHVSLVVSADGQRRALGVAAMQTIVRRQRSRRGGRKTKPSGNQTAKWADRESARWAEGVKQSEAHLSSCARRIHVADREADSYALIGELVLQQCQFVIRVNHNRVARQVDDEEAPWSKLKLVASNAAHCLEREVPLSRRCKSSAPNQARKLPPRKARLAMLHFAVTQIEFRRPKYLKDPLPELVRLNLVRVYEVGAPEGQVPVEWLLLTNEPVETHAQVERVVDIYRTRWVVEEFFKALKTGCAYEQRRLESQHALHNTLALFIPIACQILWLRSRAQHAPDAPATEVLTARQISVLRELRKKPLPDKPTVRDVLLAVAGLGGHLKRNGEPGWMTLWLGFRDLLAAERGWILAKRQKNF